MYTKLCYHWNCFCLFFAVQMCEYFLLLVSLSTFHCLVSYFIAARAVKCAVDSSQCLNSIWLWCIPEHKNTKIAIIWKLRSLLDPITCSLGAWYFPSEVSCCPSCLRLTNTAGTCSSVWKTSLALAQNSEIAGRAAPLCQHFSCHLKCVFFRDMQCKAQTFCDLLLAAKGRRNSLTS